MRILRVLLSPLALIWGLILRVRNALYDAGLLASRKGELPTLVLGNLSLGGTGKTPHTEWFIRHLMRTHRIAVLSRGYGRISRGFVLLTPEMSADEVGDEPLQICRKFPNIPVAVCEDRLEGLRRLKAIHPDLNWVILDDAFQHRRLKPDRSILISTTAHPFYSDFILPAGTLRDNRYRWKQADLLIFSKTSENERETSLARHKKALGNPGHPAIVCSGLDYGQPVPVWEGVRFPSDVQWVIGFAGIADPVLFRQHLALRYPLKAFHVFPDHHRFSAADIRVLREEFGTFADRSGVILTTEKDAMRLRNEKELSDLPLFYVPIEISFGQHEQKVMKWLEECTHKRSET